jgi:hypothetical protein
MRFALRCDEIILNHSGDIFRTHLPLKEFVELSSYQLISSNGSFACHCLVLASIFQWFRDYFQSQSDAIVPLLFNDEDVMKNVLHFIDDGGIMFTIPTIRRYCKTAVWTGSRCSATL